MRRNLGLLRSILLEAEREGPVWYDQSANSDTLEHVQLLADAGYIEVAQKSTLRERRITITRLTWKGHELASAIRNQEIWIRLMDRCCGDVPVYVLEQVAFAMAAERMGEGVTTG